MIGGSERAGVFELVRLSGELYPRIDPSSLKTRFKIVKNGLGAPASHRLSRPRPGSALEEALADRPQLKGVLLWPYQSSVWSPREALERLLAHYREIEKLGPPWRQPPSRMLSLLDLSENFPDTTIRLHQPILTQREGGLTLSLFVQEHRVYSISFSFFRTEDDRRSLFIGGVQGKDFDQSLELYRALTKAMHGLRPRDLLIEALRMLCGVWDIAEFHAVSDACRHNRHALFGTKKLGMDYDQIWEDRGGRKLDKTEWVIPVEIQRKAPEDIARKKRSMYRRRYVFLDAMYAMADAEFPDLQILELPKTRPEENPVFDLP